MKLKFLLFIFTIVFLSSCQKEYVCVCTTIATGDECTFEKEKTTKLGKSGLRKTCLAHQTNSTTVNNCDLH